MLQKLQKKTLVVPQLIGYFLTLLIGAIILIFTIQLYIDVKPILKNNTSLLDKNSAVISKNISVFKTFNKEKIYFTEKEIKELSKEPFVKNVSKFLTADFEIGASTNQSTQMPAFYTDLFFESIPNSFLDVQPESWYWEEGQNYIPIIIPESYLELYNFGFAESQGLPVLSKNSISQFQFNVDINGNNKSQTFRSNIVGFSNKINSILVPIEFLTWANEEFGRSKNNKISKLLIEFKNPTDQSILEYFNKRNYSINKEKLEFSKIMFFFETSLVIIFLIALVIIALSIGFIILSVNLIIQTNRNLFKNLYNIGYSPPKIAKFYQYLISIITILAIGLALFLTLYIRNLYLAKLENFFALSPSNISIIFISVIILSILLIIYNLSILKNIKKTVVE